MDRRHEWTVPDDPHVTCWIEDGRAGTTEVGVGGSVSGIPAFVSREVFNLAAEVREERQKWIAAEARAPILETTIRSLLRLVEDANLGDHRIANAARAVLRGN